MTSHHGVNSNPPSGQSKDVDTSLREQILQAAQSNFDESDNITDAQDWRRFLDDCEKLVASYIEAAEIDARIAELTKMNTRAMDDPDDDTNIFWYRTYTMPEYEARLAALQAQKAVLEGK